MKSEFICPICGKELFITGRSWVCKNKHSFDISKFEYVNLLMNQSSKKRRHGDDSRMLKARKNFLEKGYYQVLADSIIKLVFEYAKSYQKGLDVGCGEGWYTDQFCKAIKQKNTNFKMLALDISKKAVEYSKKRNSDINAVVASTNRIPVQDNNIDILFSIFTPINAIEFQRILNDRGIWIRVIPDGEHLWELKNVIYDNPYKNRKVDLAVNGFDLLCNKEEKYIIKLNNEEDILNLFMMTPYYYKTSQEDQAKIKCIKKLDVKIEFRILIYCKHK